MTNTKTFDPIEKFIIFNLTEVKLIFYNNYCKISISPQYFNYQNNTNTFRFKHVMETDIKNEITRLNPNKATIHTNIPPKALLHSAEVATNTLQLLFNNKISNTQFCEISKLADVTSVFKKKEPLCKTNHRAVSFLPPVSKIFKG